MRAWPAQSRFQTDSLANRAALKSRVLQFHPPKGIVLVRAAGRNSMKDHQAACTGAWPAPEHTSLQAKYLGAFRTIEGTAKAECRARCQAAEASFALNVPFFRSQVPQRFKVKAVIVGTLLAALETAPLDAHDFQFGGQVLFTGTTLFWGAIMFMCLKVAVSSRNWELQ